MSYLPQRLLVLLTALSAGCLVACEDPIPPTGTGGTVGATGGGPGVGGTTASGGTTGGGSGGASSATASVCGSGDVPFRVLADEVNNMTFTSTIMLPEVTVPPSNTGLIMDWSQLTTDFLGHELAFEGGMKAAVLVVWDIPITEVAAMINEDDPTLDSHAVASMQFGTDGTVTSAPITSFSSFGATVTEEELLDFLDPTHGYSYSVMAQAHPSTLGRNVQMIQAFRLDAAAESTTVSLTDASTSLTWSADLDTLMPTPIPAAQGSVTVDWFSTIAVNSFGGEFVNNQITEVLVGRYDTAIDLNAEFLDIELNATELWRGEVSAGSSLNLSSLMSEGGTAFAGIPAGSADQWLLGLLCSTCVNPTPWYVTRLETCP